MGREIKTTANQAAQPDVHCTDDQGRPLPPAMDNYASKLLKFVPAEIIALYVSCDGMIATVQPGQVPFHPNDLKWLVFLSLIPMTWLYLNRGLKVVHRPQLILSTISFGVWVFSIGGPFHSMSWYHPVLGALLLPLFTFLAPLLAEPPTALLTAAPTSDTSCDSPEPGPGSCPTPEPPRDFSPLPPNQPAAA